jgi:hypothetical protein
MSRKVVANTIGGSTLLFMVVIWTLMLRPSWDSIYYMQRFGTIGIVLLIVSLPSSFTAAIFGNRIWWLLAALIAATDFFVARHMSLA